MLVWILLLSVPFVIECEEVCPGGIFKCPDLSTCCQTLDKTYGCCPLKDAICCDDRKHCCPASHKCSAGMCTRSINSTTALTMIVNDGVVCPNANFTCPEDTTCCKDRNSIQYNCCPMANAVCCNDGYHCCPGGTTCDLEEQKCNGNGFITKLYASHKKYMKFGKSSSSKTMATLKVGCKTLDSDICPGEGFQCPNGNICCKLPSGNWGCSQGPSNVTSLRSRQGLKIEVGTICPDQRTCPDSETCCDTDEGYKCCKFTDATCCSDRRTCCPSGDVCWLGYCWKWMGRN